MLGFTGFFLLGCLWHPMEWKGQNSGRLIQKALRVPLLLQWGQFLREGDGSSQVVWQTGLEVDLEPINAKLLRGDIGLISMPNDYLNRLPVFDEVISLCGSCKNNALSQSPREKLQPLARWRIFTTRTEFISWGLNNKSLNKKACNTMKDSGRNRLVKWRHLANGLSGSPCVWKVCRSPRQIETYSLTMDS